MLTIHLDEQNLPPLPSSRHSLESKGFLAAVENSAIRVIDRFHIQKLACDAVQEIRIGHRWEAIQEEADARQEAKGLKKKYLPCTFENGDTRQESVSAF